MIINRVGSAGGGGGIVDLTVTASADNGFWAPGPLFGTAYILLGAAAAGVYKGFARWDGVVIPHGATIVSAYVSFHFGDYTGTPPACTLKFEDADDPAAVTGQVNGDARTLTTASISITGPTTGTRWNSNDIAAIIQEVVDRDGWVSGNAMQMIVAGSGSGNNYSGQQVYADGASYAPELYVVWR